MRTLSDTPVICVIGLGYVGLPLAAAFGRSGWKTYGFDINEERIRTLRTGEDWTHELSREQLQATSIEYSCDPSVIRKANTIIVAVPTPVDSANNPDLSPLQLSSTTIGKYLQPGSVVIYEATVYPGVTEDVCAPILEKLSGLTCGKDFFVGYSPERINPGDKEHTIEKITKVVSGQDAATLDWVAMIYEKIVTAGVHRASSIRVAELAKAIENTQRDINIALMNEIARFCDRLGIRTSDVLRAAGTKWNFLPFQPGLVGGHCIGVDPYYLVYKAKELGIDSELISAGRHMNDTMAAFVGRQMIRAMVTRNISLVGARILVMGLTFKEDVPDTRNAKVHDLIHTLAEAGCSVVGHDAQLSPQHIVDIGFVPGSLQEGPFDAILVAVPHKSYTTLLPEDFLRALKPASVFYDLKSLWDAAAFEARGVTYVSL